MKIYSVLTVKCLLTSSLSVGLAVSVSFLLCNLPGFSRYNRGHVSTAFGVALNLHSFIHSLSEVNCSILLSKCQIDLSVPVFCIPVFCSKHDDI